jgi:hypothetical protein
MSQTVQNHCTSLGDSGKRISAGVDWNFVAGEELSALFQSTSDSSMYAYWKLWVDVLNIGLDAQRVIALRLAKIAKGGAAAEAECRRMVSEKFLAAAAARPAAAQHWSAARG